MKLMSGCPCGTGKDYRDCCGIFIVDCQLPETPEQLMRSRYSAYSKANVDYIERTMKAPASESFDKASARAWAEKVKWIQLEVKATRVCPPRGFVEFIASFEENGKKRIIHELSEFFLENGQWFYVDGKDMSKNPPVSIRGTRRHSKRK